MNGRNWQPAAAAALAILMLLGCGTAAPHGVAGPGHGPMGPAPVPDMDDHSRGPVFSMAMRSNDTGAGVRWPSTGPTSISFTVQNTGLSPDRYSFEVITGISPFRAWTTPEQTEWLMPGSEEVVSLRLSPPDVPPATGSGTYNVEVRGRSGANPSTTAHLVFQVALLIPVINITALNIEEAYLRMGDRGAISMSVSSPDAPLDGLTVRLYLNDEEAAASSPLSLEANEVRELRLTFRVRTMGPLSINVVAEINGLNLTERSATIFVDEPERDGTSYILPAVLTLAALAAAVVGFRRWKRGKDQGSG